MSWYNPADWDWDSVGRAVFGSQGAANRHQWDDRDYIRQQTQQGIANAQNRTAPQADRTAIGNVRTMDTSQADQFRAGQTSLANDLRSVMSGQTAGAGELAVQRQAQRALGNAAGAATMARGNSAVSGARAAARASGAIGLGAAGQAQQAAMGDQQNARSMLAGVLGQGREQDLSTAGANMSAQNQRIFEQARLDQATSVENMRARLQAMGMNDAAIQAYLQQLGLMNAAEQSSRAGDNGILGGLIQTGGQMLAARAGRPG